MSRIKSVVELREYLLEKLDQVEDGKLSTEALKGINGTASQVIKSALTEMMFSKLFDRPISSKTIDFMLEAKEVKKRKRLT